MSTTEPLAYFGYGSLVTSATRPVHTRAHPTTVTGWVRQWRHCLENPFGKGNVCALTVARRAECQIDGVLVLDDLEHTVNVTDRREIGYERRPIRIDVSRLPGEFQVPTYIYESTQPFYRWGTDCYPILRTYVDCVMAGFLREFGMDGAVRFIRSTEGWRNCPILDDRDAPEYPRAVKLTSTEAAQIESLLKDHAIEMAGCSRHSCSFKE